MYKTVLVLALSLMLISSYALAANNTGPADGTYQTEELVYFEDFDSGHDWIGDWGLDDGDSHSAPNSWSDSPGGNYQSNADVSTELSTQVDLTDYFGATLEFWTKYDIETGFDYVYMYISNDGGSTWNLFHTFNGEGVDWTLFSADIGGYAGQQITFKFQLVSDGAYEVDGMYIDDFSVYGSTEDTSPPLIIHQGPTDSTSVPDDYETMVTVTDPSGVQTVTLSYMVDEGNTEVINPDSSAGDNYYFTVPYQTGGSHVNYFFTATDTEGNSGDSPEYHYVAGNVLYYDDGEPEYIYQYQADNKNVTRFTPDEQAILVTGMIKLYTDVSHDLDTVDVSLWDADGSNPGDELITPFAVWPQSTLDKPEAWTYVDFRGMGMEFDDDFFFGFTYRSNLPVILGDSPAIRNRSRTYIAGSWLPADADFHIRVIVDYGQVGVDDNGGNTPVDFALNQNYPNPFNAQTTITYTLAGNSDVKLEVYNLLGQKVATLVDGYQNAGIHAVNWDASEVSSGIYFYKLDAGDKVLTRKMSLLK
ncbi:MAG: T9SS type A sorting domain-containing protein [candidate division Zixibacteria bacterium]|nr:T9SS type A sorting domain-containing protein [candidate division Zixibacteria bacterium]